MFAVAFWNKHEKVSAPASDRMGEKLLYFGWGEDELLFDSELRASKVPPSVSLVVQLAI
jgi:asparagine synthase (glutamine-hydrolysing)